LLNFFAAILILLLTNRGGFVIIVDAGARAGVAQPVEQLICNQQVGGSNPSTSSTLKAAPPGFAARAAAKLNMGEFPSGQWGQTVNLLAMPSVVRIHPRPPHHQPLLIQQIPTQLRVGIAVFP
jgi:hypothetical protein